MSEKDMWLTAAAVEILIAIDKMMSMVPPETNLAELAGELVWLVNSESKHRNFTEILQQAMAARQALIVFGINSEKSRRGLDPAAAFSCSSR